MLNSASSRAQSTQIVLSTSLACFTGFFVLFALILFNGYLQNLVGDYRANAWLVLFGVIVELVLLVWFARERVTIERDGFELAGFAIVVVGVWLYFVAPSLPTWVPPTHSSDAVRHYLYLMFSYPEGKLVSWYPAGGAFVAAMLARWTFADPLRVLHPTAALFIALSAGAIYGLACGWLPKTKMSKVVALLAPALLFAPWSYFAGIILGEQYFYAQAFAQYFVVAAWWFTARFAERPHWLWVTLIGVALLGIVTAYPILVPLSLALFALVTLARLRSRRALLALAIFVVLLALAGFALERGGILQFKSASISTSGEVGEDGVANPSLENLGGAIFLLLALIGISFAWRGNAFGKTLVAFLLAWLLQLAAFAAIQFVVPISSYRVDKSFYILAFPFALLAMMPLAKLVERVSAQVEKFLRVAMLVTTVVLSAGVMLLRPPQIFTPFTESEIQVARWAKEKLGTYHINYLDPDPARAYWLAFGLWRETLPNEWFQWIPAGAKLGPATFDEWRADPGWAPYLFVRDVATIRDTSLRVVYQNGASAIVQKNISSVAQPAPSIRDEWYFHSIMKLLGYDLPHASVAPGETFTLTTYTESIYPPWATLLWRVELVNRDGTVVSSVERDPFNNKYRLQRWSPGIRARDTWSLTMPADAKPGAYEIRIGLYKRTDGEPLGVYRLSSSGAVTSHVPSAPLAHIKIPLASPSAPEWNAAKSVNARVGDAIELLRYTVGVNRDTRTANVVLYWQTNARAEKEYTVFAQLLDASGNLVAQSDAQPAQNNYPTTIWDTREIVKDVHTLTWAADARGPFTLIVGMYDSTTSTRLPAGSDDKIMLDSGF